IVEATDLVQPAPQELVEGLAGAERQGWSDHSRTLSRPRGIGCGYFAELTSAQQRAEHAGPADGPEDAAEGADDEPLGRAWLLELGVAAQPLHRQHHGQSLGPPGRERHEDRRPFGRADPGSTAQHVAGLLDRA